MDVWSDQSIRLGLFQAQWQETASQPGLMVLQTCAACLFAILMCHMAMLKGQRGGLDSGLALPRVLISRPIKPLIVSQLSAANSTSVPPSSAQRKHNKTLLHQEST